MLCSSAKALQLSTTKSWTKSGTNYHLAPYQGGQSLLCPPGPALHTNHPSNQEKQMPANKSHNLHPEENVSKLQRAKEMCSWNQNLFSKLLTSCARDVMMLVGCGWWWVGPIMQILSDKSMWKKEWVVSVIWGINVKKMNVLCKQITVNLWCSFQIIQNWCC